MHWWWAIQKICVYLISRFYSNRENLMLAKYTCFTVWQYLIVFVKTVMIYLPRVGPGCVLCTRIDPLRFLAGCRRRWLNQGLVVALGFFSLLDMACFCVIFFGLWVHAVFSLLSFRYQYQCNWLPGKIRPRNDLYVLSGTLNLTKLKLKLMIYLCQTDCIPYLI